MVPSVDMKDKYNAAEIPSMTYYSTHPWSRLSTLRNRCTVVYDPQEWVEIIMVPCVDIKANKNAGEIPYITYKVLVQFQYPLQQLGV